MCLAIYKPGEVAIPKKHLSNAMHYNDDGAGFAYSDGRKLYIQKGFFHFKEFWKAYRVHQNKPCLIHFRLATHGERTPENCHPWELCGGKYALVHNGILSIKTKGKLSDTGTFCELVLGPLLRSVAPGDPALRFLVEDYLGYSNKIAVMDSTGEATIYNESHGHWKDGAWYSNDSYKSQYGLGWTGARSYYKGKWDDVKWEDNRCLPSKYDSIVTGGTVEKRPPIRGGVLSDGTGGTKDEEVLELAAEYERDGFSRSDAISLAENDLLV